MYKIIYMILAFAMITMLSGCTLTKAKDASAIVATVSIASYEADKLQAKYGSHIYAQDALAELDKLQTDIARTLEGDISYTQLRIYYYRGVAIYDILSEEAHNRSDELTPVQVIELSSLDSQMMQLNDMILAFNEDESNVRLMETGDYILKIISASLTILRMV